MNKHIITTLPIKPQANPKTGILISPLVTEALTNISENAENVLCLNVLHSFKDFKIYKNDFLNCLNSNGLKFNKIITDYDTLPKYKEIVLDMYKKGIVKKGEEVVCSCGCGKVDIIKNGLEHLGEFKMFEQVGDKNVCLFCNEPLKESIEKVLYLQCNNIKPESIKIYPKHLTKALKGVCQTVSGSKLMLSKKRDTGVNVKLDGESFNVDIDFLLYLTPQIFEEQNVTVVTSNRQIIHTVLSNYINEIYGHKNLDYILHPYIKSKNAKDRYDSLKDIENKDVFKMALLGNLNWSCSDAIWDESKLKFLERNKDLVSSSQEQVALKYKVDGNDIFARNYNITNYCQSVKNVADIKKSRNTFQK